MNLKILLLNVNKYKIFYIGVMKYVGEALQEHTLRSQKRIVAIGIATWGIVHNRQDMTKRGVCI